MQHFPMTRIVIGIVALLTGALPAVAATETVLYSFANRGTGYPSGTLYFRDGSLYGTGAGYPRIGNGQVFELTSSGDSWKEKTLVTFDGTNGSMPFAGLIRDTKGVLYGTTSTGDAYNGGNVFALYKSGGKWVSSTIWAFGGTSGDGTLPECNLVMDKSGNLYGTTFSGGVDNLGTVFELSKVNGAWTESVLHSFTGNADGWYPYAGLLLQGSGTLYGTTIYGGDPGGDGTVFKLFKSGGVWKKKVLYSFANGEPLGTLIRDISGSLYGTTHFGGGNDAGTVFMLSRSAGKWKETILHSFDPFNGDGANPLAGLTWSPSGSLYGTTSEGGTPGYPGVGIVFALTPSGGGSWTETILHSFEGNADGSYPMAGITLDNVGALYGTTEIGGADDIGTVWKITP